MWYVIQTRTGYEQSLVQELKRVLSKSEYNKFLIPQFEDVTRTGGISQINYKCLFPGYILVDTDYPKQVMMAKSKMIIHEFSKVLGVEDDEDEKKFTAITQDDADFLESILSNGIMTVSYVESSNGSRINRIIGPLEKYAKNITKIELRRRRAIVETEVFGKKRRIKFGLWTEEDEKIQWIEDARQKNLTLGSISNTYDIGIYPGDKVRDISGTYIDRIFVVDKVNLQKRKLTSKIMMFNELIDIELSVDQVEKIG